MAQTMEPHTQAPKYKSNIPNTTRASDNEYESKTEAAYNINTKSSPPPTKISLKHSSPYLNNVYHPLLISSCPSSVPMDNFFFLATHFNTHLPLYKKLQRSFYTVPTFSITFSFIISSPPPHFHYYHLFHFEYFVYFHKIIIFITRENILKLYINFEHREKNRCL